MGRRVVLVTGGARRVGRAICVAFARDGADVAVHFRTSAAEADDAALALESEGASAATFQADLTEPAAARALVERVVERFGRLDVLVNSAATFVHRPFLGGDDESWEAAWTTSLATNLVAPARLARAAAGHLAERQGVIVNLIDINATMAWAGYTAHGASKAGLAHLTRSLSVALGPDVRVNGISPGIALFPPDMPAEEQQKIIDKTSLARAGTAEDIAEAAVFLASQNYTTGTVLPVDGGWSVPR